MRRRPMFAILFLGAALAAGCGTSPPSRFYTLDATAAATATTSTAAQSALVIAVGPVSVPAIVDRPEFVVSAGPNEVKIDDFNRWAAPLQDGLSRAVAENLVALLGTPRVVRFPQPLAIEADYRVVIEVRTFDSAPGQSAALDAVCDEGFRVFASYLLEALKARDPLARIRASGAQYLRFGLERPRDYRVIFMSDATALAPGADPATSTSFQFLVDRVRECMAAGAPSSSVRARSRSPDCAATAAMPSRAPR